MDQGTLRRTAADRDRPRARRSPSRSVARPNRVALGTFALAIVALVAGATSAQAGSGGIGTGGSGGTGGGGTVASSRYTTIWDNLAARDHRWAHRTSDCESGGDPKAIGGGGTYRGAFQFTRPTWHNSPKSPGGDPIQYTWKTQAVVAVLLKHKAGTSPWPVCGKPNSPRARARAAREARRS